MSSSQIYKKNIYKYIFTVLQAENLFKDIIKNLLRNGKKQNDPAVLEISLKLSAIYGSTGKHDLAITGFEWVIDTIKNNISDIDDKDQKSQKGWFS